MKKTCMMALAILLIVSCSSEKENKPETEVFLVVNPVVVDTAYTQEYVADIQSLQNVELRARVKGFIEGIYVDEGKAVKEGQLLFTLNSKQYRDELAKAQALLKSAKAEAKTAELEVKNARILTEKNVVSAIDLEMAQTRLDAAQAKVDEAKADEAAAALNLSYTEIRAPFSGIINRIPNKTGSLVDEGTLLTSISNNKDVLVYFYVSEREYLDFRAQNIETEENEVSLMLANNKQYSQKGIIETVDGEIDKTTGNIAFRAKFPNPDDLLKHGSNGKVLLKKKLKDAMLVPQQSTFEVQDKTYLFVVDNNNVVKAKAIIPLFRLAGYYVISPDLKPDTKIVYQGIQHLKDGEQVSTKLVSLENTGTNHVKESL